MKQMTTKDGYNRVGLHKVGENQKNFFVHRLVALGFLPNDENLPEVDHISGVVSDNSVANLRWVSRSENNRNRIVKGCMKLTKRKDLYYYEVSYCPVRGEKQKHVYLRIKFPESPECCYEAACLAEAFRDKVIAEINGQLPRFQ